MRASTWLILAQVWVSQPKLATEVTVEGDFPGRSVWKRTLVRSVLCNLRVKVVISDHL